MRKPTEPEEKTAIVNELRRIAEELGTDSVSRPEFLRRSRVSQWKLQRLFGSYNGLIQAAGLVPRKFPTTKDPLYSTEDMLAEIVRVLHLPNAKLTQGFFEQHSSISLTAYQRRFGGWIKALKAAAKTLDREQDAGLFSRIRDHVVAQVRAARAVKGVTDGTQCARQTKDREDLQLPAIERQLPLVHGNVYGDLVHFRGLEHAPVTEEGVVFLFGMICRDLGYVVEIIKPGFPDCEAKREVRPRIWQRVRIEFEFRSRTFRKHGHDPDQCDLIVCWEHDWPACPLEVVELRSVIDQLKA